MVNPTKTCRDCQGNLPLTDFHKHPNTKDGLRPECRACVKAYRRMYYVSRQAELQRAATNYYRDNKGRALEYAKRYARQNATRIAKRLKGWRKTNRPQLLETKRRDYAANKEHYNRLGRENRIANKERYAAKRKAYEKANPDIVRFHKMQHEVRKRNATGTCTSEQWRQKCDYHGWRCIYCRTPLTPQSATIEHRKPLSRGGSNWPANLGPCCRQCNQSKNCKSETEFRAYLTAISFSRNYQPYRSQRGT